ncbi:MAG: ABC transporter substrate-binding protein [Acetobacteraceae bacterium]
MMKRRTFTKGMLGGAAAAALARPAVARAATNTISFLTWNLIDAAEVVHSWIAAFKAANPGAEVEWLDKKGPDIPPFYQTQLAAGTPPDIIDIQGGLWDEYAAEGALLDLTPYLAKQPDVKARFNQDYLGNWVYGGHNYMLPFYISKTLLFYNRKRFAAVGLSEPAATFDGLMEQAKKLGGAQNSGFLTLNFDWLYWPLFKVNGIDLLTPDLKHTAFDTDATVALVERLAAATKDGAIDPISWTGRWVEPLGAFASGRIGMLNAHSPAYYFIKGQAPWVNQETLGVGWFPGYWSVPNSHGLGISKGSKNPELAWKFVNFVTSDPEATKLADDRRILTGNSAVDKALVASLEKTDPLGAAILRTQVEHTDRMTGNWPLAHYSRVVDAFWPGMQGALLGRRKAKPVIEAANRAVTRLLKED